MFILASLFAFIGSHQAIAIDRIDPSAVRYVSITKSASGCTIRSSDPGTVLYKAGSPVPSGAVRTVPVSCMGSCKKVGTNPDEPDEILTCKFGDVSGLGALTCSGCPNSCDVTVGRVVEKKSVTSAIK